MLSPQTRTIAAIRTTDDGGQMSIYIFKMEHRRSIPDLERYSAQRAVALDRGRRSRLPPVPLPAATRMAISGRAPDGSATVMTACTSSHRTATASARSNCPRSAQTCVLLRHQRICEFYPGAYLRRDPETL